MDTRWVFSPGRLGNGEACHQMQRRAALLPAPSRTESPCPRWRGNKESLVTSLLPDQQHACPDFPLLQLFSPSGEISKDGTLLAEQAGPGASLVRVRVPKPRQGLHVTNPKT